LRDVGSGKLVDEWDDGDNRKLPVWAMELCSMKKQRKHYTPEEKVAILRRHLLDKDPIDEVLAELMAEHIALKKEIGEL
jgi:hypothetical protein